MSTLKVNKIENTGTTDGGKSKKRHIGAIKQVKDEVPKQG
tara:strand:- start:2098 stop:2217 length:120 start_codon:yes stop_codon:yes gene_type:complete